MTTPNREQIVERATELYFNEHPEAIEHGLTPEVSELIECGYFWSAQALLMKNPDKRQLEPQIDYGFYSFSFDVQLMQKSNLLISGCNHSGKTRLASMIASMLKTFDWQVIALDNSGAWLNCSDLPFYFKVDSTSLSLSLATNEQSLILDISDLNLDQQKRLVDALSLQLWNTEHSKWVLLVLEESELYCKNLRGSLSQNIYRLMHSGRNRKIRVACVSTDLALIDASFIRLCSQRYHGKLGIEQNAKAKFKSYYGKQWLEQCEQLSLGSFVYLHDTELKLINADLFEPKAKPIILQPQQPQKLPSIRQVLTQMWRGY